MNRELFRSMQSQLRPTEAARTALAEKLAKKKTVPIGRYAAIAACAAVLIAALPVYNAVRDHLSWQAVLENFQTGDSRVEITKPHSYVLTSDAACWPEDASAPEVNTGITNAGGDQDMGMTPGELADNMLETGWFAQEDADAYLASGWQMTWAKWWKFYHLCEETGDRSLEALLAFSQAEGLAVNTGEVLDDLPGGAYVGEAPDQSEAVMAYQNLMTRFEADYGPGRYPEWYGGAYIDAHAGLIVNIVAYYEEQLEDSKKLSLQIMEWAGSDRLGFGNSALSLNQLRDLQSRTVAAMEELGLPMGCGVNEETGQVELTLPEATEEALWRLAELDPADTAILVLVGQMPTAEDLAEEAAPSVRQSVQPGGGYVDPHTPVSQTPGTVMDTDDVIAYEPQG